MSPSLTREKLYFNFLTDEDRIANRLVMLAGTVIEFSVQYDGLINARWRSVTRFDSKHGQPHRHIFQLNGKKYRIAFPYQDLSEAFTQARETIKINFLSMKENYLLSRRGGV